jgi:hypothetical protein
MPLDTSLLIDIFQTNQASPKDEKGIPTCEKLCYTHGAMTPPLPYRVGEPPACLKKARLDNIALVPASLLSSKDTYQSLANRLPKGSILYVETASPRQKKILARVVALKWVILRIIFCTFWHIL